MVAPREFEWSATKAAANEAKHGFTSDFIRRVFLDPAHVEFDTSRSDEGESDEGRRSRRGKAVRGGRDVSSPHLPHHLGALGQRIGGKALWRSFA
jgi:hypothetical protein